MRWRCLARRPCAAEREWVRVDEDEDEDEDEGVTVGSGLLLLLLLLVPDRGARSCGETGVVTLWLERIVARAGRVVSGREQTRLGVLSGKDWDRVTLSKETR